MYLLLSSAHDSFDETDAHLNFYNLITRLKSFGINSHRACSHSELYTPRDGYDLPKPKKYRSLHNLLIEVQKDAFIQFFQDLNCYTSWFNDEENTDLYSSNVKKEEKLKFLEKYNIPLDKSGLEDLDYLCCQFGILSLKELILAIYKHISEEKPTFSSIEYSTVSDTDDQYEDYHTWILEPNVSNFRLLRFPDFKSCERALIVNIALTKKEYYEENFNKTPPDAFILGHFVSPYHPSAKRLYKIYNYLILEDAADDLKKNDNTDKVFARCKECIPHLSRKAFDDDPFDTVMDCILECLDKDLPIFNLPEGTGKLDFLVPLDFFKEVHYTDDDHQKSLEISSQMSTEVYEALGPSLSSFESEDD
ncbi:hypothetical protein N9M53_00065 [Alphaproteobacteria bacterium]|nr:hypothetical protein [Alphaproteobacteria bacterium]